MKERRLFIHAGLHKTGTTALQCALALNPNWITDHEYRFPLSGRPYGAGHHNIAWELSHDRRFRAEYGAISDLIAEIRHGDYNVILSSEDFTGALAHPCRFQEFVNTLREMFPDICLENRFFSLVVGN